MSTQNSLIVDAIPEYLNSENPSVRGHFGLDAAEAADDASRSA
jgi:hypothetical protein